MEKDATILTDMAAAEEFLQKALEMKPGTLIGEREGKKYYFAKLDETPRGDLGLRAFSLRWGDERYKGQKIVMFGDAMMSIHAAASLMGLGIDVNSEEVK